MPFGQENTKVKNLIMTAFLIATTTFLGCALHVATPQPLAEQGKVAICHKGKKPCMWMKMP
jgi:hypothetical protein